MAIRSLGVTASIVSALVGSSVTTAGEGVLPICSLALHQEEVNRVEQELAVDLAASRLAAAESVFNMADQPREAEGVERMVYRKIKHERDVAEIEVKRQRLLLMRQEAEVELYVSICSPLGSDETTADRQTGRDEALRRYLQVDCHRIGKDLAIAEIDLTYLSEVLANVRELREHNEATNQDVIHAERDIEMAAKRVDHHGQRVRLCVSSGVGSGDGAQ